MLLCLCMIQQVQYDSADSVDLLLCMFPVELAVYQVTMKAEWQSGLSMRIVKLKAAKTLQQ